MKTMADRLNFALAESGKRKTDLWRACGVSSGAVTQWLDGTTKSLKSAPAMRAAQFLNVELEWLTEGRGQMRPGDTPALTAAPTLSPRHQALIGLFDGLTQSQQDEMMQKFEIEKQRNDALIDELIAKRRA